MVDVTLKREDADKEEEGVEKDEEEEQYLVDHSRTLRL